MSNAQTVHELFALRSQAKTPEEKQAISYAIDQAAQAMKRKPSPTDVRFVRQTKEYFEQKRDYPKGKETPIPPKEEKPKPQLYLTPKEDERAIDYLRQYGAPTIVFQTEGGNMRKQNGRVN